jgi:D-alanyl-lipoteichoic acid acyltransferase DltB (MBOAT superfamily)
VLFPTVTFATFFAVVMPVSWLLMHRRIAWRVFMLAASYLFYSWWDWHFCFLLAGSTLANQFFARRIHDGYGRERDRWLAAAVTANLGALVWFKYAGFFGENAASAMRWLGVNLDPPFARIVLPIGISFFTFQALSYVIDVHRKKVHPTDLLDFAVYLSFFPHLVAGPIVRAGEFLPQLRGARDPHRIDAGAAFWLIAAGLFKKVVIASYLASAAVDPLFGTPFRFGGVTALFGIYAYAIQIYADFSGYTDIAIGLALLLGFRFPQNFNAPYTAASLNDFWRRWHMTLSRWLRDYLYIPLGGSQHGRWRTYRNLMITMLLGGLWHGAAWTFVAWAALHGFGLVAERWWGERHPARDVRPAIGAGVWMRRIVTFNFVCLGWVFFRARSIGDAVDVLSRLGHGPGVVPLNPLVVLVVAAMLAAQFVPLAALRRAQVWFARQPVWGMALGLATVLLLVDVLGPDGVAPFIYFRF